MNKSEHTVYRCPATGHLLTLSFTRQEGDNVLEGKLENLSEKLTFEIREGIPDFTWPLTLATADEQTRQSYESIADDYDKYASLPFQTYHCDEDEIRERMVDQLELTPDSKVLEIGCGTGRGSIHIASRLNSSGRLYLQELSPKLLKYTITKLANVSVPTGFSIANGSYLPFPDNYFDAAHHFGGINTFAEIGRCLSELARVVRPGGKVVVGDEGLAPWLRDTDFGRIMANSNPLLKCEVPLTSLPIIASEVKVEWIMMGAFYVIEFRVASGLPEPDYHLQIPSVRGGSHWTRYYGQLEGVSDEAKKLAYQAREKSGKSMFGWLDEVVKSAALEELTSK